ETHLDAEIRSWLSFAEEKLREIVTVGAGATSQADPEELRASAHAVQSRRDSARIHRPGVKQRAAAVSRADLTRRSGFPERQRAQRKALRLPLFPTTTIGSFPQTEQVRSLRAKWRKGELSDAEYRKSLERETAECVRFQDELGIDVLVHGEFERNDMVEYFGDHFDDLTSTEN